MFMLEAIIGFIFGFFIGYLVRGLIDLEVTRGAGDKKKTFFEVTTSVGSFRMFILTIVSMVWVVSMATELLNPTYHVSPLVHGLMGAIVGYFFLKKDENKA